METKVRSRPNPSGRQTVRTKSVRSGVKSALRGLGLDVSRHPRYQSHDWLLRSVMSEAAVDLVIGVGAHWGSFVRAVRRLGYTRGQRHWANNLIGRSPWASTSSISRRSLGPVCGPSSSTRFSCEPTCGSSSTRHDIQDPA